MVTKFPETDNCLQKMENTENERRNAAYQKKNDEKVKPKPRVIKEKEENSLRASTNTGNQLQTDQKVQKKRIKSTFVDCENTGYDRIVITPSNFNNKLVYK